MGNYISKNKKNPKQNLMFEVHLFSANAYADHQHVYIDSVKQHITAGHTQTLFFYDCRYLIEVVVCVVVAHIV